MGDTEFFEDYTNDVPKLHIPALVFKVMKKLHGWSVEKTILEKTKSEIEDSALRGVLNNFLFNY